MPRAGITHQKFLQADEGPSSPLSRSSIDRHHHKTHLWRPLADFVGLAPRSCNIDHGCRGAPDELGKIIGYGRLGLGHEDSLLWLLFRHTLEYLQYSLPTLLFTYDHDGRTCCLTHCFDPYGFQSNGCILHHRYSGYERPRGVPPHG